ncbi:MAG: methyltransferase domain-containing protein [Xanthomonadales bacterium]
MRIVKFIETTDGGTVNPVKTFQAHIQVDDLIIFDLDFQLRIRDPKTSVEVYSQHIRQQGVDIIWLPRGGYLITVGLNDLLLPAGQYKFDLLAWSNANGRPVLHDEANIDGELRKPRDDPGISQAQWRIKSCDKNCDIGELSWNKQHSDWFFRHFDHASRVIVHMLLDDSPKLRGKILDVGCGDGIIDLAVYLRCQPELLVGIDPFKGYERLPEIIAANHLPKEVLDDTGLQFRAEDGNCIPYPDSFFDVVLSWGSLEHIAGGYRKTLEEIQRVLKPDGLFFVHPGLFYGPAGNHLGEFFDDPFIHLKIPPEELQQRILNAPPQLMDRAGYTASVEQYWQWYTELNPISVDGFEKELRAMGFEPWRIAVRNTDLVEYTPALQKYSFTDLATSELYLSAINKKAGQ